MGQRRLTHVVFDELHVTDVAPESRICVVEAITEKLFSYVDWMTLQIIATYEDERERWLDSNDSLRAMRVREILCAGGVDIDRATTTLRYPLHWHHLGLFLGTRRRAPTPTISRGCTGSSAILLPPLGPTLLLCS